MAATARAKGAFLMEHSFPYVRQPINTFKGTSLHGASAPAVAVAVLIFMNGCSGGGRLDVAHRALPIRNTGTRSGAHRYAPMPAYVISEVEMRDAAGFEAYRELAAKTIAQYGGRYLVRGGAPELVEGGPPPKAIVLVEFPSMARLREWYASAEYTEALKLRATALERRLIFAEGVAPE